MIKILIVGYFTEAAKERIILHFPEEFEVLIVRPGEEGAHIHDCDVLIPEHIRVDKNLLELAGRLKLVQTGAGFDNVDVGACTERGVSAANAAGVNAQAVAEHVMALLLAHKKNIALLDSFMKKGGDETQFDYAGGELCGLTMGIVGMGAIGKKVAAFCRAFGMKVLGYDAFASNEMNQFAEMTDFSTLIREADVITAHIFLNDSTRGMFGEEVFSEMKDTALFINTARGGIVDEAALIMALKEGRIGGAGLDVFETEPLSQSSELRSLPGVILTPHTAGMPDGLKYHRKRYDFFIENIRRVMGGREPLSALNQVE